MQKPNVYKRKAVTTRHNWTEESFKEAIHSVKNGEIAVYSASKTYGIPRKPLERRLKKDNDKKNHLDHLMLREKNERKLVAHIKPMQRKGFPLNYWWFAKRLNILTDLIKQLKKLVMTGYKAFWKKTLILHYVIPKEFLWLDLRL